MKFQPKCTNFLIFFRQFNFSHILLGSKGIELPKISQKLELLSARKTFEPLEPIADTDVQGFLRNEKETAILSVIEEVHKNSYLSAQHQKWEHILHDWKQEKIKLMNALIGPSQNWIDIRKGPEQTVLNEAIARGKSNLSNQEMAYACEVYEYNKLVLSGELRPNLVERFSKIAQQFNDTVEYTTEFSFEKLKKKNIFNDHNEINFTESERNLGDYYVHDQCHTATEITGSIQNPEYKI